MSYQITDDTDQAVKIITRFYRNFHSSRFVKDLFVIRLKHAPSDSAIEAMNEDFGDITVGPPIQRIEPTAEEVSDKTRANFCGHFTPREGAYVAPDTGEVDKAKAELERLFGKK